MPFNKMYSSFYRCNILDLRDTWHKAESISNRGQDILFIKNFFLWTEMKLLCTLDSDFSDKITLEVIPFAAPVKFRPRLCTPTSSASV